MHLQGNSVYGISVRVLEGSFKSKQSNQVELGDKGKSKSTPFKVVTRSPFRDFLGMLNRRLNFTLALCIHFPSVLRIYWTAQLRMWPQNHCLAIFIHNNWQVLLEFAINFNSFSTQTTKTRMIRMQL